jgi:hypothetical protein
MATSPISLLFKAIDNASGKIEGVVGSLSNVSFAYNNISSTIASVTAQSQQLYAKLIGQNVELQQQLLSTQSSLAATNKIISQGVEVTDPTKAIKALTGPVNQAVADIRKGSLELVGVTSAQLIPLFQITAQNSANIGASLRESGDLTLSFAAALGTLQIPLDQARQELTSIYTAQITSDSQLAKSLGLNNQMVNQWKAQGILVEKLTERLGAFRAGNALAANTIEGVSSNIQEIFDEIARVAGEPLLQPIVSALQKIYSFLQTNAGAIQSIAQDAVNFVLMLVNKLGEAGIALQPAIKVFSEALFTQLGAEASVAADTLVLIVDALVGFVKAAAPVLEVVANITKFLAELAATDIGKIILQATLILGLLGSLAPILTVITAAAGIATTAIGLFTAAGGGVSGLVAILGVISPQLAAIATAATAAGGGIAGMGAAAAAAAPAITAAMAPLLPLIALGGAIALTLIVKKTGDLRVANEEIEEFRRQNNLLSDESLRIAQRLKNLNDLERANGELTEEQNKKRRTYQRISQDLTKSLEGQITALKEIQPASEAQKRTIEAQIAQLQKQIDLQNKLGGGTKLQARDIAKLGGVYEQLSKKVADAQSQFNNQGGGDAERFKQSAQEIVELTNKQLELGQITREQAEERLSQIRDDSRVEYEIQLAALDAITKARQSEVDKRVSASETEQSKIEELIKKGVISDIEGQRRTTEAKKQQLQIQLTAVEAAITKEVELREKQVNSQIEAFDKQLAEAQKARDKARSEGDKGGVRIANEDIAKIESQKTAAQQSLQIETERLGELKKQRQDFNSQITSLNSQSLETNRQQRLKDYDEQLQILESRNARGLITEQEFANKSLKIQQQKAQTELKIIAQQKAKLDPKDKEGQEALAVKEAQIQQRLAEAKKSFEQQKTQAVVDGINSRNAQLEASFSSNLISEAEYNQRSLELTKKRIDAELAEVNRQRQKTPKNDTRKLAKLAEKEASLRKQRAEAQEKFELQKSQARIAIFTAEQTVLENKLSQGLMTEQEYNQKSLELTQNRLDAESTEVDRQRQKTNANDKKKLAELAAKEANINKKRIETNQNFQQQRLKLIDDAQKTALALTNQSEQKRLLQIKNLEKNRNISAEEAAKQRLSISRETLNKELKLEKNKLQQLESLPKFSDPRKEKERQEKIRSSRLKTTQLTTQLIDNEISQQQALQRIVEKRLDTEIERIQNNATAQSQATNQQIELQKAATESLKTQINLLESRKNLVSSVSSFYQSELSILKETSATEEEKKQIAETAAEIRLKTVREQAKIEQEILELNIQQKQAALEQEKLQLRIQKIQASSATLTAQANLKQVQSDPSASPEKVQAEELKVQAAVATELGLQQKESILNQQGFLNQREAQLQRNSQKRSQQTAEKEARLNLANSRVSEERGERERQQLKTETLRGLSIDSINQLSNFTKSVNLLEDLIPNAKSAELRTKAPPQTQPTFKLETKPVITQTGGIEAQLIKGIEKMNTQQSNNRGDITINLSNNFTRETPQQVADKTTDIVRKEMYNLAQELNK